MTNSSTPTSSISSRNNFNETLNEFFRPEFLIIDMALTVGIDTAALETFELILNYCRKHDVTLVLSGSERHLDYLVQQGIFLPNNHHPNLDAYPYFKCPFPDVCLGGNSINGSCKKGYDENGPACATVCIYLPITLYLHVYISRDTYN